MTALMPMSPTQDHQPFWTKPSHTPFNITFEFMVSPKVEMGHIAKRGGNRDSKRCHHGDKGESYPRNGMVQPQIEGRVEDHFPINEGECQIGDSASLESCMGADPKPMVAICNGRAIDGGGKEGSVADTPTNFPKPNPMQDKPTRVPI